MPKSNHKNIRSAPTGSPFRSSSRTKEDHVARHRVLPIAAALVATMTLVLFMATLVAANTLATQGTSSGGVNAKIAALQNENANLQTQVASLTAVSRIYSEALNRGYVAPDKVIYTTPPGSPVALSR